MLRASTTFFAGDRLVQAGEIVSDADPIVKGREALFAPVQVTFPTVAPVEQATAEPGARRSVRRAKAVDDG